MKNKEFIKKSIEDNIVDRNTVLNNLKAKAMQLETEKAVKKPHFGIGFKRVVLIIAMFTLITASVLGSSYLFNSGNKVVPPDIYSVPEINSGNNENEVSKTISETSTFQNTSSDVSNTEISNINDESKETQHGGDESNDIIIETPLENENKIFFDEFSKKYTVLQKLINAKLEYDNQCIENGYAPVLDEQFQSQAPIEDFLDSFLTPALAGEIYNSLISGDSPIYYEVEGILYINININGADLDQIYTESAYLVSETENKLAISAMLKTTDFELYHRFNFEKSESGWLYAVD